MNQSLLYDEIRFNNSVSLDEVLKTSDNNETCYCVEIDLNYPHQSKCKPKNCFFSLKKNSWLY